MPIDANGAAAMPLRCYDQFSSPINAEEFCLARLFRDISDIIRQQNAVLLRASVIIESLSAIEWRPWTTISSQYPCDAENLGLLLRLLDIRLKTIPFVDGKAKAYLRLWFESARGSGVRR